MNAIVSCIYFILHWNSAAIIQMHQTGKRDEKNGADANVFLHARVRYPHIHTSSMNIRNTLFWRCLLEIFYNLKPFFFYYLNRGRIQSSVASIGCRLLSHYLRPLFIIRRILVFPSLIFRQEMHQLLWCELMSFQALHNVRHQDLRFFIIFNADLYANYFPLVIFVYWSFENYGALSSLFYF